MGCHTINVMAPLHIHRKCDAQVFLKFSFFNGILFNNNGCSVGGTLFLENIIATVFGILSLSLHCEAPFSIVFRSSFISSESSRADVSLMGLKIEASSAKKNMLIDIFSVVSFI